MGKSRNLTFMSSCRCLLLLYSASMNIRHVGRPRFVAGAAGLGLAAIAITTLGAGTLVGADANDGTHTHNHETDPEHGEHYHAADLDGEGRFTGQGEVWPPRPDGAGEPTEVPNEEPEYVEDPLVDRASRPTDVADLLGERWDVLEVIEAISVGKGETDPGGQAVTFFSYDNNQSVRVELRGGAVTRIETTDPARGQLPLNPEEKERAIDIARDHWSEQGESAVNDLEGFSIQAFEADGSFYDVRMVYVSFHQNADTRPDFLTWVDLSNESVADAKRDEG